MNRTKINYDGKDLLIISHLRADSRSKLTSMSRDTRIPVSTIFDKIRLFKSSGLIRKNTSIVSFERFGYATKAMVFLSALKEERAKLSELLQSSPSVNSLFRINSGWDFVAEVIFPGFREIEDFLEKVEEKVMLKDKKVFYVVEELKREEFMANPKYLAMTTRQ